MSEVSKVNLPLLKELLAANRPRITGIVANWIIEELQNPNSKEVILERAALLQERLGSNNLDKHKLSNKKHIKEWILSTTEKTKYWDRVEASLNLYKNRITNTGRGAAMFWGFHYKWQDEIKEKCPIDFITPGDDPRQRPHPYKKIIKLAQRFILQRAEQPSLYIGYHGPIEWLWQKIAFTHVDTTPGELGTLEYILAPPKLCMLIDLESQSSTSPEQDAKLLERWKVTGDEFKQLASIRGNEQISSVLSCSSGILANFFINNYIDPYNTDKEGLKRIHVENEALRLQLFTQQEKTFETQKEHVEINRWNRPPKYSEILDLFRSTDFLKDVTGGLDLALSSTPELSVKLADKWLTYTKSQSLEKRTIALHAFIYAWSCGSTKQQTEEHIQKREILKRYCEKYQLGNVSKLGWNDLDAWLEIAEQCSNNSKYFKRHSEGGKLLQDRYMQTYRYMITAEMINDLFRYPEAMYIYEAKDMYDTLSKTTQLCRHELSPIEQFCETHDNPVALALLLLGADYPIVSLAKENKAFKLLKITAERSKAILSRDDPTEIQVSGLYRLKSIKIPDNCFYELLVALANNYLPHNWEINNRIDKIPTLGYPSPFLLEVHRIFQNTKLRLKKEFKFIEAIVKLVNPEKKIKNSGISIGIDYVNKESQYIKTLIQYDAGYLSQSENKVVRKRREDICKYIAERILSDKLW